jgi:hypothetical protein
MNKKQKGSALAYGLIIIAVTSTILVSMIQYSASQTRFGINRVERENAFQIAEAGIYYYRWYLAHQVSGKTAQQIKDFWQNEHPYGVDAPFEQDYFDPEGGKIGAYSIEVEAPDPSSTIVMVKSTGWTDKDPSVKRTIQARFRRPSWSEYAVLADDVMRFGSGTQVFGKIHSNYGIHFDGVANNIISSSVYSYVDPDYGGTTRQFGVYTRISPADPTNPVSPQEPPVRTDVFQAGRQFPLPTADFNGILSDLNYMKTQAQLSGRYFDDSDYGRRIILKSNGTFDVCKVSTYDTTTYGISRYRRTTGTSTCTSCSGSCLANYPIPDNGIIFVEDNAWIEGTVSDRRVTVVAANLIGGSPANAYIGFNNILYTNFDGSDIIGIIGQKNVTVVRDSQNNLTIDAALLAQSGKVGRDHYDSSSYDKNTITINGSLATKLRYGFAYTDGRGYVNRILNFDNNLLYFPPPYFPTGTEYYIDLWDEV